MRQQLKSFLEKKVRLLNHKQLPEETLLVVSLNIKNDFPLEQLFSDFNFCHYCVIDYGNYGNINTYNFYIDERFSQEVLFQYRDVIDILKEKYKNMR